jgi:hypothetical protein
MFYMDAPVVETHTGGRVTKAMRFGPRVYTGFLRPGTLERLGRQLMYWEDVARNAPEEVVVHLLHRPTGEDKDSGHVAGPGPRRQWSPCKMTLVGGAVGIRTFLGLAPSAPASELPYRSWLRVLTPEEYLAEVGPEQVALETKVDPYSGPPAVYAE